MAGSAARYGRVLGLLAAGTLVFGTGSTQEAEAAQASGVERPDLTAVTPSSCTITGFTPRSVTLGGANVEQHFQVQTSGASCTVASWKIVIDDAHAESDQSYVTWLVKKFTNVDAGKFPATVSLLSTTAGEAPATYSSTFTWYRASTWGTTFNATPEPVKKGKKITLKGTVRRIDWTNSHTKSTYVNLYSGASVQVQFRAQGTSTYKTLKTVLTATGGKVSTTITASKSGTWRLHFVTTATTAYSTSTTDYVEVKN